MFDRLEALEKRYKEIDILLAKPDIASDAHRVAELARERASLEDTVARYQEFKTVGHSLEEIEALLKDGLEPDFLALVKEEKEKLLARRAAILQELKLALLPRDPNDARDVIIEVRAGTGGEEAALFAADLFRMYTRYAQAKGWAAEVIDISSSERGGFKEVILEVKGKGAFSRLKYERGVHRVQRVPVTEASGRIHTSTATVAVLPEAADVELAINPEDLKVEFYHSRGAGGQNVNKVATAVRVTHLSTGITAQCQDERSQLRNRHKAMAVLRARLLAHEEQRQQEELSRERRAQVGTGERAEKVRTYNFPQNRVSDHRIGLTLHRLPEVLEGNLDEIIDVLVAQEQAQQLQSVLS